MNIQQQLFPTLRRGVLRCLAAAAILALASCTDGMDDDLTPPDAGQQSPGEGISFEITIAPPSLSLAEEPFLGTPPAKEGTGVVSSSSLLAQTGGQRTTPNPSLVRRGTKITPAPTRAEEGSSGTPPVKEGTGEVSSSALLATAYLLPEPSAAQTRASVPLTPEDGKYKAAWETGDAIGIFAVETDNALAATGNPIHNVRLTRQEDGTWKPDPGTTLFWPRTDRSYYFAAYYPYTPDMDDAAHHFAVATNQNAADPSTGKTGFDASVLLFGTSDGACTRGKPVTLTLRHATTMVVLSLDDRISALDLSRDFSVTLRGVNTGVSCSPSAAALQPSAGSTSGDIVMQRVEQPETPAYRSRFTFRALIPSTSTANPKANFRIRNGGLLIDATADYPPTTADAPAYRFTCPIPADALPRIPKGRLTYKDADNIPATIIITEDYRAGRYEVTAAQFAEFLNAKKIGEPKDDHYIKYKGDTWGQVNNDTRTPLSWNTAARRYEAKEGREDEPVNYVTQKGATAYAEWAGGRLPTLDEWQYACRAGSPTAYYFGDESSELGKYAVYVDNSYNSIASVGTKLPNAWGLYDMHGNVSEWTSTKPKEEWSEYYASGGSYAHSAEQCRSDYKESQWEEASSNGYGFRVFYTIPAQ